MGSQTDGPFRDGRSTGDPIFAGVIAWAAAAVAADGGRAARGVVDGAVRGAVRRPASEEASAP